MFFCWTFKTKKGLSLHLSHSENCHKNYNISHASPANGKQPSSLNKLPSIQSIINCTSNATKTDEQNSNFNNHPDNHANSDKEEHVSCIDESDINDFF